MQQMQMQQMQRSPSEGDATAATARVIVPKAMIAAKTDAETIMFASTDSATSSFPPAQMDRYDTICETTEAQDRAGALTVHVVNMGRYFKWV